MRTARAVYLVAASLLSVGCAGHVAVVDHYQVPAEQLRAYQQIKIAPLYSQDSPFYENLGPVSGLSCDNNGKTRADERHAIEQLKLKALQLGGDAISPPGCGPSKGVDWANNCWTSILCEAVALKKR